MTTAQSCPFLPPGYDFTDPDVLLRGIPVTEFAELRKTAPVWWNAQDESIFDDGGYWVISRHEDIKAISRDGDAVVDQPQGCGDAAAGRRHRRAARA